MVGNHGNKFIMTTAALYKFWSTQNKGDNYICTLCENPLQQSNGKTLDFITIGLEVGQKEYINSAMYYVHVVLKRRFRIDYTVHL